MDLHSYSRQIKTLNSRPLITNASKLGKYITWNITKMQLHIQKRLNAAILRSLLITVLVHHVSRTFQKYSSKDKIF